MITTEELLTAARQAGESAGEYGDCEEGHFWAIAHAIALSTAAICERLDVLIDKADEARRVGWAQTRRGA